MKNRGLGACLMLTAAVIWGFAFSFQDRAGATLDTFGINALRFLIGGLVLIPVIYLFDRRATAPKRAVFALTRTELVGGIFCGLAIGIASCFQQAGILGADTGAGDAAFITALYVVMVPLISRLLGRRQPALVFVSALIAVVGFYFMTMADGGGFAPSVSDLFVLASAFVYSIHILVIDFYSPKSDGVRLSMVQFFTASLFSMPMMLFFERPTVTDVCAALPSLLYLGVFSCGVAYTFQVVGQKYASPAAASMLLSLESVFGAIGGALLLGERMSDMQILGAAIVFSAILLSQFADVLTAKCRRRGRENKRCHKRRSL